MLLKHQHLAWLGGLFVLSRVAACAADLGTLDTSDPEALEDALGVGVRDPIDPFPPIPPDPFQPGDERLSVGYFYEGGRSATIEINASSTNYFVFAIDRREPVASRSFTEGDSTDRVEGRNAYEITLNGSPFWAGGIVWFEPIDISEWTTMYVSLKSSDRSFARFDLILSSGDRIDAQGNELPEPAGFNLDPTNYGYVNDGEWHFLQIPLQDAVALGWDPTRARSPFTFAAPGGDAGDVLLIDNLYFTKE